MFIKNCNLCNLSLYRSTIVNGEGNIPNDIMIIGEAPGFTEDKQGKPFVGKSGELLRDCLKGIGLDNNNCYITNIVKCRPPNNRQPELEEINKCKKYLYKELKEIEPKFILLLGNTAARIVLETGANINVIRGNIFKFNNITIVPTYHPSFILRNPEIKEIFIKDLIKFIKLYQEYNPLHQTDLVYIYNLIK